MSERRDPVPPVLSRIGDLKRLAKAIRQEVREGEWEDAAESLINLSADADGLLEMIVEAGLLDDVELVTKAYVVEFLDKRGDS